MTFNALPDDLRDSSVSIATFGRLLFVKQCLKSTERSAGTVSLVEVVGKMANASL